MESHGSMDFKKNLTREGKAILSMDTGVFLIEKQENLVEFFGFTANKETSYLNSLCMNHLQLLKSFATHFKNELSPILIKMQAEPISLSELKGQDFFCQIPINSHMDAHTRHAYLKDLGLESEVEMIKKLSPREKECLKLLIYRTCFKIWHFQLRENPRGSKIVSDPILSQYGVAYDL